jgi:aminoglycoside N3'-acetyltransferase
MKFNIVDLENQLKAIGVEKGDTILVRANIGRIGRLDSRDKMDYLSFILNVIGPEGTVVALSFTDSSFIVRDKTLVFDDKTKSNAGSFPNLLLSHKLSLRSLHPTNSYTAIGKNAKYILDGHNHNSGAYDPIKKIIELDGKMILIGCVENSPGFTTAHLAEIDLDLHRRIIFPSLNTVYFKTPEGKVSLFKRKDLGGCSASFYKFYSYYVKNEALTQGYIGKAYSIMIKAKKAYEIEYGIMKNDNKFNLCENPICALCRARRWDNLIDIPAYLFRKFLQKKQ